MLVLGIDPGTAITGYGLVREETNGKLEAVDYGVIQTATSMAMPQRLLRIFHELKDISELHRPDYAARRVRFRRA